MEKKREAKLRKAARKNVIMGTVSGEVDETEA